MHPDGKVLFNLKVPDDVHVTLNVDDAPPGSLIVPPEAPSHMASLPVPLAHPIFLVIVTELVVPGHCAHRISGINIKPKEITKYPIPDVGEIIAFRNTLFIGRIKNLFIGKSLQFRLE